MKHSRTLFDTPVLSSVLSYLARFALFCWGWKLVGDIPTEKKYIFIAAPHTSNWDFFFMALLALKLKLKIYWMGKHTLFNFPFKGLATWMGGISIDRTQSNDIVASMITVFDDYEELIVAVPPEGTRAETSYWKTGFYHIAHGAKIPICLGYLDYSKKEGALGPMFWPTGDAKKDIEEIQKFYKTKTPKYPEKFSLKDK